MLDQFSRTELLLGKSGMDRLKQARVAVFGIGGVGGYAVEALARSGAGNKPDPTGFEVADIYQTSVCSLAKVMRRELKKRSVKHKCTERRDIPGSNAFVPAVAGLILTGEVIKDLAKAGERDSKKVGGL